MSDHNIEIIDKFKYLRITLENTGGWRNQKASIKAKGNQALTAIDTCLATTSNMKVMTLENIYEMLCESRIMYAVELWDWMKLGRKLT
jgi:hypothetical protein